MNQLGDVLQQAVAEAPPSRIDLDALIDRQLRLRDRRRWWAGGGAAVMTAAVVTVTTLSVGGGSSGVALLPPSGSSVPDACAAVRPTPSLSKLDAKPTSTSDDTATQATRQPTEPRTAASERLGNALTVALRTVLPGRTFADTIHPTCPGLRFQPDVYPALYYASIEVTAPAGKGTVVVMMRTTQYPSLDVYDRHETLPDGTRVGWFAEAVAPPEMGVGIDNAQVGVLRPDGTYLTLLSINITHANYDVTTAPAKPATIEQLIAIATAPGLTLFP